MNIIHKLFNLIIESIKMKKDTNNIENLNDLKSILKDLDAKISHIEDIEADNRKIIIELVRQSNQVVTFLKQIQIEELTDDYEEYLSGMEKSLTTLPKSKSEESMSEEKKAEVQSLIEAYLKKSKDLKELEDELKKHKDKITPGQVGEA